MPIPVSERIAAKVFNRLQRLATGYSQSTYITEVVRPLNPATHTPEDKQIVLFQRKERNEELDFPGNPPASAYDMTFSIRVHLSPSEGDTTPIDTYQEYIEADVQSVLTDGVAWHNWDGIAINSRFESPETGVSAEFNTITIPLVVTYRTSETNLYTARA